MLRPIIVFVVLSVISISILGYR